jgi:hypothetical protein
MPASIIAELILQPILEFIFNILGYYVGRIVVFIFTLDRIKCNHLLTDRPRRKIRWWGLFQRRGQQIYLTAEMTAAIGVIFVVLLVAGGLLLFYGST